MTWMKFCVTVFISTTVLLACGNDTSNNEVPSSPITPGVQNVNGNLPDSSNTIELNQSLPVDSSRLEDSIPVPKR